MGTPREPQGPITIDITYSQIMEAVYGGISMMDHVKSRDKLEFFAHGGNTDCLHQLTVEIARQVMAKIMRSVVEPDVQVGGVGGGSDAGFREGTLGGKSAELAK